MKIRLRSVHRALASFAATFALLTASGCTPPSRGGEGEATGPMGHTHGTSTNQSFVSADGKPARFDFLEPGFVVRPLPVEIPNVNNVEYATDGRLFAAAYDGTIYMLRDSDGDALEDTASIFSASQKGEQSGYAEGADRMPLGMAVRGDALYVTRQGRIERLRDTNADGVADESTTAATGWSEPEAREDETFLHRRVDDAIGLAIDAQGILYTSLGTPNYENLYQIDAFGKSRYRPDRYRGAVIRIAPGGKPEIIASGVRFLVSMQFNRHGDLFGTDQEGATWGPGNPFDELLHIEPGRHYGFPPRDARHLPDVIDEPSTIDFGPQHQSTCGFRFDEARPGFRLFGPGEWQDNALVTGESRGKLWRVQLARTRYGYVGKPVLIGSLNTLPVDVALSPRGDLVLASHGGEPDWGSGPSGIGKLYKVSYEEPGAPRIAVAWPESASQVRVAFTSPLPADAIVQATIEGGRYVRAADELETFRPGYDVIGDQLRAPRQHLNVKSVRLDAARRHLILETAVHPWRSNYALKLQWSSASAHRSGTAWADYDFHGVQAFWTARGEDEPAWTGWLPHPDLTVARTLTLGSRTHDTLFDLLRRPGRLAIESTLANRGPDDLRIEVAAPAGGTSELGAARIGLTGSVASQSLAANAFAPWRVTMATNSSEPAVLTVGTRVANRSLERPLSREALWLPGAPESPAPEASRAEVKSVKGDIESGRKLFATTCAICHQFRGEGQRVGPDLSNSPTRDPAALRRDIVDPNASINPDYRAFEVTLNDGRSLLGTVTASSPGRIRVHQIGGAVTEVGEGDMKSKKPLATSLMPPGFEGLGEQSLIDLIAFLTASGRKE